MEVYLDNAATTRVCPEAADIAYKTMLETYGNPSSTHTKGREAKAVLDNARKQLAAALDCAPGEVYFTSCGSEGDNWAIINGAESMRRKGLHIISSEVEHDAVRKSMDELKRRGVAPFLVCDEGGGIISEPVGGIKGNYAMIGVFEKGQGNVKFTARSGGGHSSAPPKNSPIARLAAFENSVEKHSPFKKRFPHEVEAMFETLAPYAGFGMKLLFGNMWLFKPLLKLVLPTVSAQAGAMLQTTVAFTMQSGSDARNVLPTEASVWANMRFIPHQGMDESLRLIKKRADKYGLETEVISAKDYTEAADIHGEGWHFAVSVIERTFPGLAASPYVMTGGTDARFYQEICPNCIRFGPVVYGPEQLKGMHGLNENITCDCLQGAVDFYKNLIDMNK